MASNCFRFLANKNLSLASTEWTLGVVSKSKPLEDSNRESSWSNPPIFSMCSITSTAIARSTVPASRGTVKLSRSHGRNEMPGKASGGSMSIPQRCLNPSVRSLTRRAPVPQPISRILGFLSGKSFVRRSATNSWSPPVVRSERFNAVPLSNCGSHGQLPMQDEKECRHALCGCRISISSLATAGFWATSVFAAQLTAGTAARDPMQVHRYYSD